MWKLCTVHGASGFNSGFRVGVETLGGVWFELDSRRGFLRMVLQPGWSDLMQHADCFNVWVLGLSNLNSAEHVT